MEVEVRNLAKRFGKVVAVDNVSFRVKSGEFFFLLGPSGSGKTTVLRCIAGLEDPDKGDILIDGVRVNDVHPSKRDIAMVFQNYALYPHMTVYENLAFPLKMRGLPRGEIEKRVREVAELLRISELLNRKPAQLSGGQQQRVALGRALVRRPKVFLMDEPLSNLDAKLRVYMRAELKKMQKDLGITTIYVTHDQVEAMTMADRIALLNKGVLQQVGTPSEVYHRPANMFVAGFIGSPAMNFFEASVVEEEGRLYIDTGDFKLELPSNIAGLLRGESEVVLGVRPEHIRVYMEKKPGAIPARVFVVEPLGFETIIDFRVDDRVYKARYPKEIYVEPGTPIYLEFDMENIHIFRKKDGKVIV